MSISIFFPLRSGSQRVVNKNTKPFLLNNDSLFQLKMKQIVKLLDITDQIHEVVISTNDPLVMKQAEPFLTDKIKLIVRPDDLCLSTTKVVDLINYIPTIVTGDHVFWLHATSPFVNEHDYLKALEIYKSRESQYDSLMSVNEIKQFIWDSVAKKVINVDREANPWPNTQDLDSLYEVNHAFYISSVINYKTLSDRIGLNPKLFICESLKKVDIDWEEDFKLAQLISERIYHNDGKL